MTDSDLLAIAKAFAVNAVVRRHLDAIRGDPAFAKSDLADAVTAALPTMEYEARVAVAAVEHLVAATTREALTAKAEHARVLAAKEQERRAAYSRDIERRVEVTKARDDLAKARAGLKQAEAESLIKAAHRSPQPLAADGGPLRGR
jgi:hypothetical protein